MVKISDIFDIHTGTDLVYSSLDEGAIPVIGHSANNNGIVSYTKPLTNRTLYPKETITLAHIGNFVAYVQFDNCYIGTRVKALIPKIPMCLREKFFYCMCLNANNYRFSYGRVGSNKFQNIEVPSKEEIPKWVYDMELPKYEVINGKHTDEPTPSLDVEKWGSFKVSELFEVEKGNRLVSRDRIKGTIPYVSATTENNGVEEYIKPNSNKLHDGNTISIVCYGEPSIAFYQKNPYYASDSVNILYPKFTLNSYIALFMCTIFRQEKYRYNYGRGLNKERLENLVISLPTTKEGTPDWEFMEKYIKTLKYSKEL